MAAGASAPAHFVTCGSRVHKFLTVMIDWAKYNRAFDPNHYWCLTFGTLFWFVSFLSANHTEEFRI